MDDFDTERLPDAERALEEDRAQAARRRFLAVCGRVAIATPPAIYSLTMSTPRAHASGFGFDDEEKGRRRARGQDG